MRRTATLLRLAFAGLFVAKMTALPHAAAQTDAACDRACLNGIADAYFAALVAHSSSKAPMAPAAKFTEQAQVVAVGEGLWKTATEAPTTFKIYVPDPVAGQIGGIVMMKDTRSIEVAFRLKVRNRQITEAEHLIAPIANPSSLVNLVTPRPGLLETVPPAERLPRELMLLFGHGYYDALEQSDGKAVPFADDCVRHENGIHTAGPRPAGTGPAAPAGGQGGRASSPTSASGSAMGGLSCAAQLDTRFMSYIEKIELRRVWIADPETGLVFGLSMFRHPMNEKILTLLNPDGSRGTRDMTKQRQFDMAAAHIFKVRNYKIHEIEATGFTLPLNSKNGWNERRKRGRVSNFQIPAVHFGNWRHGPTEQVYMKHLAIFAVAAIGLAISVQITDAQTECESGSPSRACLMTYADNYFSALAAHDPSKVKMAPDARFTEQAQVLKVGEGLWKTMTEGPKTFKIYVPDPVSREIGALAIIKSDNQPTEIALRLKVENGRIIEAEHLLAHITNESSLANLAAPRPGLLATVPAKERLPREMLLLFAHGYYDAIEQSDGNLVPFADDCVRRENGMQTAGPRQASAAPAGGGALPGATGPAQLCGPQLTTRVMSYIDSIDLRRVRIADPETGLVFGLSMFRHAMTNKTVTVVNPDGTRREREMNFQPFDLEAGHIFKVQGNKIHEIEAMGFRLPLYSKNGWSEFTR